MARVRMVNPEMFLHESLGRCSAHARLLFIALWTQADRSGRLRWIPLRIHGEAFPHEPDVDVSDLGAELIEAGVLIVYDVGHRRFASLPGFARWQKPHARERESICPPPPEGEPGVGHGSTQGSPDTEYGIRITDLRNTDKDSSNEESCSGRRRGDGAAEPPERLEVPTGDELLDFLLDSWGGLLGKHATLARWILTSREAYPGVDLLAEARRASAWEQSNPAKKKKQVRAFLSRWWGRAQDRGGSSPLSASNIEADALAHARSLGASV